MTDRYKKSPLPNEAISFYQMAEHAGKMLIFITQKHGHPLNDSDDNRKMAARNQRQTAHILLSIKTFIMFLY
jgi:hypothetical protein